MSSGATLGALLAVALLAAGCGGESEAPATDGSSKPTLTVSAAASLKKALTAYGEMFTAAEARFSFAGSDELAAQIEQGAAPDVYAAANTKLPQLLFEKGLVEEPTVFAGNRLVLAVPAGSADASSLEDVERRGVTVAVGSESVPVGSYTRTVLDKLPARRSRAILANVRSEEPDVAGIVGKLTQGAVDAGFVYISDVRGTRGKLQAVELPADLQPSVSYGVAVVKGTKRREQAEDFVEGLVDGSGQQALAAAGFEPPPAG